MRHVLQSLFLTYIFILCAPQVVWGKGPAASPSDTSVRGYTRSNGKQVAPYMRSQTDGIWPNNFDVKGNTNPYTHQPGTKVTPPLAYGGVRTYDYTSGPVVQPSYLWSEPDSYLNNRLNIIGNATDVDLHPTKPLPPPKSTSVASETDSGGMTYNVDYPRQGFRPDIKVPTKIVGSSPWATNGMTGTEKAEHAKLARSIKSHGEDLVYWNLYSVAELQDIRAQLIAADAKKAKK